MIWRYFCMNTCMFVFLIAVATSIWKLCQFFAIFLIRILHFYVASRGRVCRLIVGFIFVSYSYIYSSAYLFNLFWKGLGSYYKNHAWIILVHHLRSYPCHHPSTHPCHNPRSYPYHHRSTHPYHHPVPTTTTILSQSQIPPPWI